MAVTAASLVIAYPEFAPMHAEDSAYVVAVVAIAERRISPTWPEDTRDDIVMLQAADTLARSPMGRNAKMSEPGVPTSWGEDLKERKKAHAFSRSRVV